MTALVVGANGATGRELVRELLNRNVKVKIIVRGTEKIPNEIRTHQNLTIIEASILHLNENELLYYIKDCDAVASCLGHNLSLKGIFGNPKMLVTDAVKKLCNAIKENNPTKPVKFVLMNTTAVNNKDISEKLAFLEKSVFSLLRNVLPPQLDNEHAAAYLRKDIGRNNKIIEWSIVRPDTLINETTVSEYSVFPSPIRSPIFDAGKTSRINVGHFMAELIT
ncbi:MAG: SDR family oxidoreductase, partial [Candidatus Omnitrophica bacterium]|nr:SDR family oxidoreductase [Candidatus Omnitrophota bacterium]